MNNWHIHITGRVQGVGFRPYVYRLAAKQKLNGIVYNDLNGVHIEFLASKEVAIPFYKKLIEAAPTLAKITGHELYEMDDRSFEGFQILQKKEAKTAAMMLPPDFAICKNCRKEVLNNSNRRGYYSFITCTECGPRYSLIKKLPFERECIAMDDFKMCPTCGEEYSNPKDRRYHSQTNSCSDCGVRLSLMNNLREEIEPDSKLVIKKVVALWKEGKIVAIKGIGGYLLTCDASNAETIKILRKRKHRPSKPFACMYPNASYAEQELIISATESKSLTGEVAPIVLLRLKKKQASIALNDVAPGLDQIGVMLPYTPLYELLLQAYGKPIIATSANLSNASIVFEDIKVFSELAGIWDYVLSNDREIVTSQDDSVLRFSSIKKQPILIRRSRGLAPNYFGPISNCESNTILAMGASQKSVFGLLFQSLFYLSQYLGDLAFFESTESYKRTLRHFMNLLNCQPEVILVDMHPNYYSTEYGKQLATTHGAKLVSIQHHYAHFAAILSEHELQTKPEEVLGVIWDGTGYGDDGNIWGGEFLTFESGMINRLAHLSYVPVILGDKMALEPRISALAHSWENTKAMDILKEKFSEQEWKIYRKILAKGQSTKTSSMGRLFDAVACLLGIMDTQTYEGEAALQLETLAQRYFEQSNKVEETSYVSQISYIEEVPVNEIIEGVVKDLKYGVGINQIAYQFHYSLVKMIENVALTTNNEKIAFSGGVFQNALLVDLVQQFLGDKFELYFHREVSPNDENIALGQLAYYQTTKRDEISK
ncbi:carbamoyltransferase HypF [Maribacter algarum]|uniref:Carbamoyltransferase n=1 Tax=Maribacter algarum (ex Zhang et al. 2020) TaxID=2578118 RepID=A0A5S3QGP8_9FLAO|nr:carbamoyltransferase HypF [Maribacter algarum]TMM56715.1 carbamoyltransferase HypF [Maribacter algarum]